MEDNFYYRVFDLLVFDLIEILTIPFSVISSNTTNEPVFWILSFSIVGVYGLVLFAIFAYTSTILRIRQRKRLEEYATAILLASAYETYATDTRCDDPQRQTISLKHDIFNKEPSLNIVTKHKKHR